MFDYLKIYTLILLGWKDLKILSLRKNLYTSW